MLTKFWESAGEGLSEQWLARLFGPAFVFWSGGVLILASQYGFEKSWNDLTALPIPIQSGVLIAAAIVLIGSSSLMKYFRFPFMRFLEGYWFWPLNYLGAVFIKFQQRRIKRVRQQWSALMVKRESTNITSKELQTLAFLEQRRRYFPAKSRDVLPTTLGNILRTAETRPKYRYGLDAVLLWPRLWLLLPKDVQEDLSGARQQLDKMIEVWTWGLLFLVWGLFWQWAWLIALLWMIIAYTLASQSATVFSDILEATFDTQRWLLYTSLHWPLPEKSGESEAANGEQLTQFLQRGWTEQPISYEHPKEK